MRRFVRPIAGGWLFATVFLLVIAPGDRALGATGAWLVAGGNSSGDQAVMLIVDDTVVGQVHDPNHYFADTGVDGVAIAQSLATGYARLEYALDSPIVIIDLLRSVATGKVADPLGLLPAGGAFGGVIAAKPDGTRIYFTSHAIPPDGGVGVVDTLTNTIIAVLSIPRAGTLAISPDQSTLYVRGTDCDSNDPVACPDPHDTLYKIDTETDAEISHAELEPVFGGGAILPSPDGSSLYATFSTGLYTTEVVVLDAATLERTSIADPNNDISAIYGLTIVGSTLYVFNKPQNDVYPQSCKIDIVMVDMQTKAVSGVVAMNTGLTSHAFGANLDGSQIFAGYIPAAPVNPADPNSPCVYAEHPPVTKFAILDTATTSIIGDVSDPRGLLSAGLQAVDPFFGVSARRCISAKRKLAGKEINAKLACFGVAQTKGIPVSGTCLQMAEAKFTAMFEKVAASCPGDAATVNALVGSCVAVLAGEAPGAGPCPARSTRAIGKGGQALLKCAAAAASKPAGLTPCNTKADGKLQDALTKVGGCASTSVLQDLDAECVTPILDALPLG